MTCLCLRTDAASDNVHQGCVQGRQRPGASIRASTQLVLVNVFEGALRFAGGQGGSLTKFFFLLAVLFCSQLA